MVHPVLKERNLDGLVADADAVAGEHDLGEGEEDERGSAPSSQRTTPPQPCAADDRDHPRLQPLLGRPYVLSVVFRR